jgi:hypothetical protein
MKTIISI